MTWQSRTTPIKVGDTVAYSAAFLRSTGQQTGDIPFARGVVTALKQLGEITLADIDWGNPDIPARVNVKNLCKPKGKGFTVD